MPAELQAALGIELRVDLTVVVEKGMELPYSKGCFVGCRIRHCKNRNCKDAATLTRYQAVRLYGEGYSVEEIMQITGCSRTSLMEWCRAYREDHSQGLVDKRAGGNRAKLSKLQIEPLRQLLHQYTPKERLRLRAGTVNGLFWSVEDLALVV